jgi:hypothetical protein
MVPIMRPACQTLVERRLAAALTGLLFLVGGLNLGATTRAAVQAGEPEQPAAPSGRENEQAVSEASSGPFVGLLPQGMVQLVGLTEYPPTKQSRWFQPDGSPAEVQPVLAPYRRLQTHGRPALSFLVLAQSVPPDVSLYPVWEVSRHQGWEGQEVADASGRSLPECRILSAIFPSTLATVNLRVGYGMGPWDTVVTLMPEIGSTGSFTRNGKRRKATLQQVKEPGPSTQGPTRVTVMCTVIYPEWEVRLVAIDHQQKEHISPQGNIGTTYMASFDALPLSAIKEFHLQLRPYSWVEFKNVSLHRGRKTNVKVIPPAFGP